MLSKRPLVFLTIGLIFGIVMNQVATGFVLHFVAGSSVVMLFLFLVRLDRNVLIPVSLFLLMSCIGFCTSTWNASDEIPLDSMVAFGKIPVKIISLKKRKKQTEAISSTIIDGKKAKILLKISKADGANLTPGALAIVSSKIYQPGEERIPDGFNYRKYLAYKNIDFISYVKYQEIEIISTAEWSIQNFIWSLNSSMMVRIDQVFESSKYKSLIKGILLGYKDEIESEARSKYGLAGIGHVFAVSGMHVGMVYVFCFPLLFFRHYRRSYKYCFPIIVLLAVWIFVLSSGATPSAVRAGIMISIYEIGVITYRQVDKWNVLACSALISLLVTPNFLFDIGFQFSYLALAGIFYFYTRLSRILTVRNLFLRWIYCMMALSVSAQLVLLPLSLYYFSSFSPYFWLNSLIATFVVQVNFFFSLFVLICPAIQFWFPFIISCIDHLFSFMNDGVNFVMSLPCASITWKPSEKQMLLMYGLLIFGCLLFRSKDRRQIMLTFFTIGLLALTLEGINTFVLNRSTSCLVFEDEGVMVRIQKGGNYKDFNLSQIDVNTLWTLGALKIDRLSSSDHSISPNTTLVLIEEGFEMASFSLPQKNLNLVVAGQSLKWKEVEFLRTYCKKNRIDFHFTKNGIKNIEL